MEAKTATIRVPTETRDLLAEQAQAQGVSVATMLTDLAKRAKQESAFQSERHATRVDSVDPEVREEEEDWGSTVGDGV